MSSILDGISNFEPTSFNGMAFMVQLGLKGMALLGVTPNMKQNENHSWSNIITSNPIESGAEIQDHMVIAPLIIRETFIVSFLGRLGPTVALQTAPIVYLLMELRKTKQIIDVVTNCGIYRNMAIASIEAETVEGTINTVQCTITFQEILLASVSDGVVSSTSSLQKTANLADPIENMACRSPIKCAAGCTPAAVTPKTTAFW